MMRLIYFAALLILLAHSPARFTVFHKPAREITNLLLLRFRFAIFFLRAEQTVWKTSPGGVSARIMWLWGLLQTSEVVMRSLCWTRQCSHEKLSGNWVENSLNCLNLSSGFLQPSRSFQGNLSPLALVTSAGPDLSIKSSACNLQLSFLWQSLCLDRSTLRLSRCDETQSPDTPQKSWDKLLSELFSVFSYFLNLINF